MNSWGKYTLVAVMVTVAGFTYIKSSHRNIPSDLRDAVADNAGFQDFDGKAAGSISLIKAIKTDDSSVPAPEKVEVKPQASQNETSEIKAVLKWPNGRREEGLVVCSRNSEALSCSVHGNSKGGESDFMLAGLMHSMTDPSFSKHSYDNWNGSMHFSCVDKCRDVKKWVGQTTIWTKKCGLSTTVSTTELSGEAGCEVTKSTEDRYEIEHQWAMSTFLV